MYFPLAIRSKVRSEPIRTGYGIGARGADNARLIYRRRDADRTLNAFLLLIRCSQHELCARQALIAVFCHTTAPSAFISKVRRRHERWAISVIANSEDAASTPPRVASFLYFYRIDVARLYLIRDSQWIGTFRMFCVNTNNIRYKFSRNIKRCNNTKICLLLSAAIIWRHSIDFL